MCTHMCSRVASVCMWRSKNIRKRFLSFHHVGTRDGREVTKHLAPLSICGTPYLFTSCIICVCACVDVHTCGSADLGVH